MIASWMITGAIIVQGMTGAGAASRLHSNRLLRMWCKLPLTRCDRGRHKQKDQPVTGNTTSNTNQANNKSSDNPLAQWVVKKETAGQPVAGKEYPLHEDIVATYFEAGTPAGEYDAGITNVASAWIENWRAAFGGPDRFGKVSDRNPDKPYHPAAFTPKENPFYVALPANPWKSEAKPYFNYWGDATVNSPKGAFKDQWVEITTREGAICYAQWEDVGPGAVDKDWKQYGYVFGTARPRSTQNAAGIDVSPACAIALGLTIERGMMPVSWRFVDTPPPGPWTEIVTKN